MLHASLVCYEIRYLVWSAGMARSFLLNVKFVAKCPSSFNVSQCRAHITYFMAMLS